MELEPQPKYAKKTQAHKDKILPENKENFNSENRISLNPIRKELLEPSKPIKPSFRYFETHAEKINFIKQTENPQKNKNLISLQNQEAKKIKTVRGNFIEIDLKLTDTEKNATDICKDSKLKTNKTKITKVKFAKKDQKDEKKILTTDNISLNMNTSTQAIKNNLGKNLNEFAALKQEHSEENENNANNNIIINPDLNISVKENAQKTALAEDCNKNNFEINKSSQNVYQNLINCNENYININNEDKNSKFVDENKNELNNKKTVVNKQLNKPQAKKLITMDDYLEKENVIIIRNYGNEIYRYMRTIEDIGIPNNFMDRHKINPEIRTKMVDWIVEVLSVYKCEHETFFLSIYIMDSFIYKTKNVLTSDDVHVLGLTAMFIASKFEDVIPIRMSSLVTKIGHDLFVPEQITKLECKILEIVEFDKLIISSVYEFIRTFFYDFRFNNKRYMTKLKMEDQITELEKCSILFAKLMFYPTFFYNYEFSLKAITCIISAFDTLRNAGKFQNVESESFFREWIMFLIEESSYTQEKINEVYGHIINYHADYNKIPLISYNLNKFPI